MLDSAAAMDAIYRRQRFIYDLTLRPYLFGRDQMLAELEPPSLRRAALSGRRIFRYRCIGADAENSAGVD